MKYIILTFAFFTYLFSAAQVYNPLTYRWNATPTNGVKIKTNIPFTHGVGMPTIHLEGYAYGKSKTLNVTLNWYPYNGAFYHAIGSSSGGFTPNIKLANDNGKVSIYIDEKIFFLRFNVRAYAKDKGETAAMFEGWTAVDEPISGTNIKEVSFLSSFTKDVVVNTSGNLGIGTTSPLEKLHLKGNLYIDSGINDNKIYWNDHNMTMGTRPGAWTHNIFHLKPGGASQGVLYSTLRMYTAISESEHQLNLQLRSTGNSFFNGGNVGIGTDSPDENLSVYGNTPRLSITGQSGHSAIMLGNQDSLGVDNPAIIHAANGHLYFGGGTSWNRGGTLSTSMMVADNGNVGIGTKDTKGFKLGVNGKIAATEVKVALYDNWPDYVFKNEYALPTLKEVENHITEKGHLEDIPSAAEVAENGIMLGNMNAKLLQKIEELTLYTIAQEKSLAIQEEKIQKLKNS